MPSLRVTAPDGSLRTLPFHGSELTVGRASDNVLVLELLGASDEELDVALQWPRYEKSSKGIVMHEPGHTHHMHVRFKCAPHEKRCRSYPTNDGLEL